MKNAQKHCMSLKFVTEWTNPSIFGEILNYTVSSAQRPHVLAPVEQILQTPSMKNERPNENCQHGPHFSCPDSDGNHSPWQLSRESTVNCRFCPEVKNHLWHSFIFFVIDKVNLSTEDFFFQRTLCNPRSVRIFSEKLQCKQDVWEKDK